jgi:WD40 repeat protein
MRLRYVLAVVMGLALSFSLAAGKKKTAPVAPEKRSFSIPVSIPNPNNPQSTPGECVVTAGPAIPISAVAFAADSKRLFVGGYKEVLVWDLEGIRLAQRLGAGQLSGQVRAVAFSKDGKNLAVAEGTPGASGAVRLLDIAGGKVAATFAEAKDEFISLAFSPDGKLLAAGGSDGAVRVWNSDDQKLVKELKGHGDWVSGIAFSPDGRFLASGSIDKTVQIWEAGAWNPIVKLPQPSTESVHGLAFSPNSEFLAIAVGGAEERAIRIWRTASVEESKESATNRAPRREAVRQTRPIDTGACSALGVVWGPPPAGAPANAAAGRMFVPCTDKSVRALGPNGATLGNLAGHTDWVYSVAASPDGARVASGSGDGAVRLWTAGDARLLATLVQLAPATDRWAIVTPRGFFATSAADSLHWKTADSKTVSADLVARLESPESVREALKSPAGKIPLPPPRKVTPENSTLKATKKKT